MRRADIVVGEEYYHATSSRFLTHPHQHAKAIIVSKDRWRRDRLGGKPIPTQFGNNVLADLRYDTGQILLAEVVPLCYLRGPYEATKEQVEASHAVRQQVEQMKAAQAYARQDRLMEQVGRAHRMGLDADQNGVQIVMTAEAFEDVLNCLEAVRT